MLYQHDLKTRWDTASQIKPILHDLLDKLKVFYNEIYENVSEDTVALLGRAHSCAVCININMSDDISIQTEKESIDTILLFNMEEYGGKSEEDDIVIINLFHDGLPINLREI